MNCCLARTDNSAPTRCLAGLTRIDSGRTKGYRPPRNVLISPGAAVGLFVILGRGHVQTDNRAGLWQVGAEYSAPLRITPHDDDMAAC
jgi:hypothetical protein